MPETQKEAPPKQQIVLVCTGKVITSDKKPGFTFQRVLEGDSLDFQERVYSQKGMRSITVGHVYTVDAKADDNSTIYPSTIRWSRVWGDKDQVAAWQTVADAWETAQTLKRREKNATAQKIPLELLKPIRKLYHGTNFVGRLAIEVQVLAYLRYAYKPSEYLEE